VAQGWKTLAAATVVLLGLLTASAQAQQPVTPLGPQLRLTQVGADGDQSADADSGDVAYNAVRNEYLVVWEQSVASPSADQEIFARRLAGDGSPLGPAFQVSGLSGLATADAADPAVAYDAEHDRYAVAYLREVSLFGTEVQLQQVSGAGAVIETDGTPGPFARLASVAIGVPESPAIVYRPDASGDDSPGDRWVVAYDMESAVGEFEVYISALSPTTATSNLNIQVSDIVGATADAFDPAVTTLPGVDDVALAFEGFNGTETEIYAKRMPPALIGGTPGQTQITNTPGTAGNAFDPDITTDTNASRLVVAFRADKIADGDFEIGVQQLDLGLGQVGADDQVVSSAGTPGPTFTVVNPMVAYSPSVRRSVVAWIGNDTGRPGLSNDEREVQATSLDASGAEGAIQDFVVSRTGADNDDSATVLDAALTANTSGRWMAVWTADDPRPPLADNEFELYGRQLGENFDLDADGSPVPADCNDGNPGIRPGVPDVADNNVDEDCSGADTVNLDRDGDGSPRPADCNDANAAIAPGKRDIPNNDVDEDCANGARRVLTSASIERFFQVFRTFTKVTKLRVTKVKPGMKVRLRCTPKKGKGCPKKLRGNGRTFTIKKAGSKTLTSFVKKAELEPGATLEVRILEPGAIGRLDKFEMRKAKLPKRVQRCVPFGKKKAQKTC
jgi:hypothetical protein